MTTGDSQALDKLAEALGITRSYYDGTGVLRRASDDAVLAVVRALGAPVERIPDAADALRAVPEQPRRALPAVAVATAGASTAIAVNAAGVHAAALVLESGERRGLRVLESDGSGQVVIPRDVDPGCHRLELDDGVTRSTVIVAPGRLPEMPQSWCVFAPLYALRRDDQPLATYGDLARLASWITAGERRSSRHRDVALLGTLPLLACFFEEPFEPSPYSPISRSFWSEIYVDPSAAAEAHGRSLVGGMPPDLDASATRVDYRRVMKLRRREIESLLTALEAAGGTRRDAFERAIEADDELARYAAFRAAVEQYGTTWERWPSRTRGGSLRAGVDYDGETFRYHAYAQWLAREQVEQAASASAAGLYLDLPLGSHGGGYDTWRYGDEFVPGIGVGAPPDAVFEGGQNWGFPPLDPGRAREKGYTALRAALRHHFAHAALVRVDHVMGLHRSFWIPEGFTAADGVYVRSHTDEMWALVAAAAVNGRSGAGTAVVGEDLGTVPDEVRDEMRRRGALRMHVVPFECRDDPAAPVAEPPRDSFACLGTHDMEPFATWWDAPATNRDRIAAWLDCEPSAAAVLPRMLSWLARSDATVASVNLEDLWLERERQNLPGSPAGTESWQRRFAREFESFAADPAVRELVDIARGAADARAVRCADATHGEHRPSEDAPS